MMSKALNNPKLERVQEHVMQPIDKKARPFIKKIAAQSKQVMHTLSGGDHVLFRKFLRNLFLQVVKGAIPTAKRNDGVDTELAKMVSGRGPSAPKLPPAPVRTNCGFQSSKFGFISNKYNLPGTPVKSKSLSQCVSICKNTKGCVAFSYKKGSVQSDCWLKSSALPKHSGNTLGQGWYTYVVAGCEVPQPTVKCGFQSAKFGFISNKYNLPGTPVKSKTLLQCIIICKHTKACVAFSYIKGAAKSDCWLKSSAESAHAGNKLYKTQKWYTYVMKGCHVPATIKYRRHKENKAKGERKSKEHAAKRAKVERAAKEKKNKAVAKERATKKRREQAAKAKAREQKGKQHERRSKAAERASKERSGKLERANKHRAALAKRITVTGYVWGNNMNGWDGHMNYHTTSFTYISGLQSWHSNRREDRIYKPLLTTIGASKSYQHITGYVNNFDRRFDFTCPGNRAITGMFSYHSNRAEDRRWRFYCASFHGVGFRAGGWPGFQTSWDAYFNINCGQNPAIGFSSYHDNRKEDRRWRIRCGHRYALRM